MKRGIWKRTTPERYDLKKDKYEKLKCGKKDHNSGKDKLEKGKTPGQEYYENDNTGKGK